MTRLRVYTGMPLGVGDLVSDDDHVVYRVTKVGGPSRDGHDKCLDVDADEGRDILDVTDDEWDNCLQGAAVLEDD